jgi:hypothetical protein
MVRVGHCTHALPQVAGKAYATLLRVGGEGKTVPSQRLTEDAAKKLLSDAVPKASSLDEKAYAFVVSRVQGLVGDGT